MSQSYVDLAFYVDTKSYVNVPQSYLDTTHVDMSQSCLNTACKSLGVLKPDPLILMMKPIGLNHELCNIEVQ